MEYRTTQVDYKINRYRKWRRILSETGYDAIEMMCGPEAHIDSNSLTDRELKQIKSMVEDHGLKVAVINPYKGPGLYQMALANTKTAIDYYSRLQDVAVTLEAGGVNFLTGYGGDKGDSFAWKLLIEVLQPICQRAERLEISMNIHNHEATTIDTPDKVELIVHHVGSENLKLLNDITNFYHLGSDLVEVTTRLFPLTIHCHVKGVKGMYPYSTFLIPGAPDDELDFRTFAHTLGQHRYNKYISVETFSSMPLEKVEIAYKMMSTTLRDLGLRQ